MYLPNEIKNRLTEKDSEHFIVHYAMRNPESGRGLGAHGVRDESIIQTYIEYLEKLYKKMISPPWNRERPIVGPDGKTHVYVYNSSYPFMTCDHKKVPYIVLTSRNSEPTVEAELNRAASEAVHEATHLFNFSKRPLYKKFNATRWEWFDEGLAVLMEMLVTENTDHYRLLVDWIDSPEMPLDHPDGIYHVGMFMHYLGGRLGYEFVNDVWLKSDDDEEPLDALHRLTPKDQEADLAVAEIFIGYSFDPYFLRDHAYDLFMRFGERAVAETLKLADANVAEITDHLNHLSCRYYRIFPRDGASDLKITLQVKDASPLTAVAAVVATDKRQLTLEPLRVNGEGTMSLLLSDLEIAEVDHIVLVVSNFGTNRPFNGTPVDHDGQEFKILIQENSSNGAA